MTGFIKVELFTKLDPFTKVDPLPDGEGLTPIVFSCGFRPSSHGSKEGRLSPLLSSPVAFTLRPMAPKGKAL